MTQRQIPESTPPTSDPELRIGEQSDTHLVLYCCQGPEKGQASLSVLWALLCLVIGYLFHSFLGYLIFAPGAGCLILQAAYQLSSSGFSWEFDRSADRCVYYVDNTRVGEWPLSQIAAVELRDREPLDTQPEYDLQVLWRDGSRRSLVHPRLTLLTTDLGALIRPPYHASDDYFTYDYAGLVFPYQALGALLEGSAVRPECPPMVALSLK